MRTSTPFSLQAERFTRLLLRRCQADTETALEEVRILMDMSEYGREFYVIIEHALYHRLALERDAWRY